jgi:hypothetical protein
MNLLRSEVFRRDVERQLRNYSEEYNLDDADVLKLCSRFNRALNDAIQLISANPEIGRQRLREYAPVANARSKALPRPFERFGFSIIWKEKQFSWTA